MVLQSIRERLTGILAFVILGILVIPFAFVGINSYFETGGENIVARVNDQEITFTQFNSAFLNYRRQLQARLGTAYDPSDYDNPVARREFLDNMIDETLLTGAARDMGLDVDDDRLAEQIRSIPTFQVDGEFNSDVYQARLLARGLTTGQFENELRTSMVLSQLPGSLRLSSFATDAELREFIALQNQTRNFHAVVVPAESSAEAPEFSDEEIAAWYERNQGDYQTEERVVIEYLELSADTIDTGPEPDEDSLRDRFESQKGRFLSPERRQVSHVLIEVTGDADEATRETARQEAEDIAERARAGEDFAALASAHSDDAGSAGFGGDLGWVQPGDMVEAFENAMYELSLENPVSEPVQTGFGWHVILLRDVEESTGMSFEEARPVLLDEYREEQAERAFLDLADRMVDIIYEDPTTLEAAALDMGQEIHTAGPFTRAGGEGLAANPEVIRTAFSDLVLLQGTVSDPVDLAPNHMVMIRLREHLPVKIRPLAEVRDAVVMALQDAYADDRARERAEALLAASADSAAGLEAAAQEAGLEMVSVEDAGRVHAVPDSVTVSNVFKLPAPPQDGSSASIVRAANGHAVVVLEAVTAGVLADDAVLATTQYRRMLANANASTEAWALVRQLREQAKVQVFEDNLGVSR